MSEAKHLKEATTEDFDGFETGEYFDEAHASETLEMADLMKRYGAASEPSAEPDRQAA